MKKFQVLATLGAGLIATGALSPRNMRRARLMATTFTCLHLIAMRMAQCTVSIIITARRSSRKLCNA